MFFRKCLESLPTPSPADGLRTRETNYWCYSDVQPQRHAGLTQRALPTANASPNPQRRRCNWSGAGEGGCGQYFEKLSLVTTTQPGLRTFFYSLADTRLLLENWPPDGDRIRPKWAAGSQGGDKALGIKVLASSHCCCCC